MLFYLLNLIALSLIFLSNLIKYQTLAVKDLLLLRFDLRNSRCNYFIFCFLKLFFFL